MSPPSCSRMDRTSPRLIYSRKTLETPGTTVVGVRVSASVLVTGRRSRGLPTPEMRRTLLGGLGGLGPSSCSTCGTTGARTRVRVCPSPFGVVRPVVRTSDVVLSLLLSVSPPSVSPPVHVSDPLPSIVSDSGSSGAAVAGRGMEGTSWRLVALTQGGSSASVRPFSSLVLCPPLGRTRSESSFRAFPSGSFPQGESRRYRLPQRFSGLSGFTVYV